jgi:hypothetical protein
VPLVGARSLTRTLAKGANSDLVENNLDALLTALCVDLDDRVLPALGWSVIICRAESHGSAMPSSSVSRWPSNCSQSPLSGAGSAMPAATCSATYLPKQSGYGKRLRAQGGLIAAVITELARDSPCWWQELRVLDSTPLPCAASRETVKRSQLAGHAGYGYRASHSRFFWGLRLYLIAAPDGMPIIWGLANPKLGEREVTHALLEHDHG